MHRLLPLVRWGPVRTWPKLMASHTSPPKDALTFTTLSPASILASVLPSVGSVRETYAPPSLPRANLMPSGLLRVTCRGAAAQRWQGVVSEGQGQQHQASWAAMA